MLGLLIPLLLLTGWLVKRRDVSPTTELARLENIDADTLKQIFATGEDLAKKKPITPGEWDILVKSSNAPNWQLRQEAYAAMSEARTSFYRDKALMQIEHMKTDIDSVRCFYVGHLIALKSEKWKAEADAAMNDKSETVRQLAKDAVANAQTIWLKRQ